jgi:hypothetical protein
MTRSRQFRLNLSCCWLDLSRFHWRALAFHWAGVRRVFL